jgi:hypothetical protein
MTKRDFVQIAAALLAARPTKYADDDTGLSETIFKAETVGWGQCCLRIADALKQVNPRFDRERFLSACGMES